MHCLTRCVLSWEPDRRREVIADLPGDAQQSFEIDAFAILSLARLPFRHLSNRFSTLGFRFAIARSPTLSLTCRRCGGGCRRFLFRCSLRKFCIDLGSVGWADAVIVFVRFREIP